MTTQSISPESLSIEDWQGVFARPIPDDVHAEDAFEIYIPAVRSFDNYDAPSINEIVANIGSALLWADADDRLDLLQAFNPDLTDDNLDQIAEVTERWLDSEGRERLRSIARYRYDNRPEPSDTLIPSDMLMEWSVSDEIPRLIGLLNETSIPDQTLAACYALAAAYDAANSAYIAYSERMRRQTNFADIGQSAEEIAADLRFANAE